MGVSSKFFAKHSVRTDSDLTPGAKAFLEGRHTTLTAADVDPANSAAYARYEQAMLLKQGGDLKGAAALLEESCSPPSIYKGHYRELFKVWRQLNRDDFAAGSNRQVVERVRTMVKLDDELISEMLRHWSNVQARQLPTDYFDADRNLLQSDAKALLKAASALKMESALAEANVLLQRYVRKSGA
jgi:hypothetical protein